ncbi:NYN domain-containing protein [Halpernia humi]|uniref:NYN domain-containing protein n=1 Tax=Halpernia humi TaxID=493375 RepID=A0A1H5WML6_9FLAO|nr:NYN domain-containing protein [Halpernia humi]SEG00217.1 NYN domain-containing protein [Halpernia humi]
MKKERVIVYIDGFNLYFGLMEAGFDYLRWLNVKLLAENIINSNQILEKVIYFTSRVNGNPDKQKRQSTYLEALEVKNVDIIYGQYNFNTEECKRCGNVWANPKEKMTDVNIATQILIDAFNNKFDMAILISGDSDLVPPLKVINSQFKDKRVFVAFPPKRNSVALKNQSKGSMVIGRKTLKESQLEEAIKNKFGYILTKPNEWS